MGTGNDTQEKYLIGGGIGLIIVAAMASAIARSDQPSRYAAYDLDADQSLTAISQAQTLKDARKKAPQAADLLDAAELELTCQWMQWMIQMVLWSVFRHVLPVSKLLRAAN